MIRLVQRLAAGFAALSLAFAPVVASASTSIAPQPYSLTRTFTSSTTDTVPSWATGAYVTEQGGGGGGSSTYGGGSGFLLKDFFTPVTPGATLTITIGAGGASGAPGSQGGNTSVSGAVYNIPPACGGTGGGTSNGDNNACGYGAGVMNYAGTNWGATQTLTVPNMYYQQAGNNANQPCVYDISNASFGGCSVYGKPGAGYGGGSPVNGTGMPGLVIIRYVQ